MEGRLTEGSYLLDDDDLRHAVQVASFILSIVTEVLDGSDLREWDAFGTWSQDAMTFLHQLANALGALARGDKHVPIAIPAGLSESIFSTIVIRPPAGEASTAEKDRTRPSS